MFQVSIREEDQYYHRILRGTSDRGKSYTYVSAAMIFGATFSPCSAQFVKNTNAGHFVDKFSRAACLIKDNHYIDDLMDSVPTEEEANKLAREIRPKKNKVVSTLEIGFHMRLQFLQPLTSNPQAE